MGSEVWVVSISISILVGLQIVVFLAVMRKIKVYKSCIPEVSRFSIVQVSGESTTVSEKFVSPPLAVRDVSVLALGSEDNPDDSDIDSNTGSKKSSDDDLDQDDEPEDDPSPPSITPTDSYIEVPHKDLPFVKSNVPSGQLNLLDQEHAGGIDRSFDKAVDYSRKTIAKKHSAIRHLKTKFGYDQDRAELIWDEGQRRRKDK